MVHSDKGMLFYAKKKWAISYEKTQSNLKCMLLSEKRQPEKAIYYIITTLWHSGKGKTSETIRKSMFAMGEGSGDEMNEQSREDA